MEVERIRGRKNKKVEIHISPSFCHLPNSDHAIMFLVLSRMYIYDGILTGLPTSCLIPSNPFPTQQIDRVSKLEMKNYATPLLMSLYWIPLSKLPPWLTGSSVI